MNKKAGFYPQTKPSIISMAVLLSFALPHLSVHALDMNYILVTGQSLSVGGGGAPALSTTQSYGNLRLNYNERPTDPSPTAAVPLISGAPYGTTEQPKSAMADGVSARLGSNWVNHPIAISTSGKGGAAYVEIAKGTDTYAEALQQVADMMSFTASIGPFKPRAVFVVHGEADSNATTTQQNYMDWMTQWQSDYQTDINAITGQSTTIPMFHSQVSSFLKANVAQPQIALAQSQKAKDDPSKHIMVGPKYFLPYNTNSTGLCGGNPHPINEGYRWMGNYYAKAYKKVMVDGGVWKPLSILTAKRNGKNIYVDLDVPSPPVVIDNTLVPPQADAAGNPHKGFQFTDGSAIPPVVVSVTVVSPKRLFIKLDKVPNTNIPSHSLTYAAHLPQKANTLWIGKGNIRDSDPETFTAFGPVDGCQNPSSGLVSKTYTMHNWLLHSKVPVVLLNP